MKATAYANSNIALTKYWGKRDEKIILPHNSSLSITLDGFGSTTTVEFSPDYSRDEFVLDDNGFTSGEEYDRVVSQLDLVRNLASISQKAKVVSRNSVYTASGVASSASGAAALAMASVKAAGLKLDTKQISILARQGSGSACRSIYGGFVMWKKGEVIGGGDSYAEPVAGPDFWPDFRAIAVLVKKGAKKIKSRAGMADSVKTSPYYQAWKMQAETDTQEIYKAIMAKDFERVGRIAEKNCLNMHAVMLSTQPPLIYWTPETLAVIHTVQSIRESGLQAYFTIDAGPQVVVLCLDHQLDEIVKKLESLKVSEEILVFHPGQAAHYQETHLF